MVMQSSDLSATPDRTYVHGYSEMEAGRLHDQATTLSELLHHDSLFQPGGRVLEAGCGTGAQTRIIAAKNPQCSITSIDLSERSLQLARKSVVGEGLHNVEFARADIFDLPFSGESFDHVFVCFVLEHLPDPPSALRALRRMIAPGGTITVIEGDHGSAYYHPRSDAAQIAIQCLVDLQAAMGGDSLIGRRLYPLVTRAGFTDCRVSPRMVYADTSRPEMQEGFTRRTFTAMVAGVRDEALSRGLVDSETWDRGIADLYRTAESDGTFCYTFFKAVATPSSPG